MSSDPTNPFSAPYHDPKPNPYQSPDFTDQPQTYGGAPGVSDLNPSILTQQRVVAILMIVQGTMTTLMGLMLAVAAVAVPMMIEADMRRNNGFNGGPPPAEMRWFMLGIYGVMGLCALSAGLLQIYGGIQGIRLRNHTLGLVALGAGVLTVVTCYCFPTSLALLIYGLIIYFHDTTRRAFELAKQGHNFDAIMQMAQQRRY
jgi:hypothetical protein